MRHEDQSVYADSHAPSNVKALAAVVHSDLSSRVSCGILNGNSCVFEFGDGGLEGILVGVAKGRDNARTLRPQAAPERVGLRELMMSLG